MVSWGVSIKLLCLERSCHSKILFRQLLKKKIHPSGIFRNATFSFFVNMLFPEGITTFVAWLLIKEQGIYSPEAGVKTKV